MSLRHKAIITCAPTGAIHTPSMSEYLPVTAKEIATASIEAAEAGAASATATGRRPAAEKLEVFSDDFHAAALLPGGFVLPGIHAQPALDVDRPALFRVFARDFREASPEFDIDENRFLALLAIVERVVAIDREPDICDRAPFRGELDLGIAGDVADQDNFVDVGHGGGSWVMPRRLFSLREAAGNSAASHRRPVSISSGACQSRQGRPRK